MSRRYIHIFCGVGMGKTSAALGKGFREASSGKRVVVIRFLKKKHTCEREEFFKQLEPQIRLFRFEKFPQNYESLTEQEKEEEIPNLKNGLNFARKVLATGECDVLILDEVLGLPEREIATLEELHSLLEAAENTDLIFTGIRLYPEMLEWADEVYEISVLKGSE